MYYYFNVFFILSILGHIIENFIYVHVDSGILFGPWTPIYGIGTIIIILINNILKKLKINKYIHPIFLFVLSAVFLSTIEYIGGILIEKLYGRIFWDYSYQKFNIGKYASLKMSLIWGLASILVIYILIPFLDKIIKKIPKFITWILISLFIIDIIFTIISFGQILI